MREIKFRAWDKVGKKMFNPMPTIDFPVMEMNAVELMQYTGLKDKNGKEIYEGDIVSFSNNDAHNSVVEWTDIDGAWRMRFIKPLTDTYYHLIAHICKAGLEVIGNIYENKELLKTK